MKTFTATPSTTTHKWFVVDADGQVLGRLASEIAKILRGKHKPIFTPHMDTGDCVIVVNASKVVVTGRKAEKSAVPAIPNAPNPTAAPTARERNCRFDGSTASRCKNDHKPRARSAGARSTIRKNAAPIQVNTIHEIGEATERGAKRVIIMPSGIKIARTANALVAIVLHGAGSAGSRTRRAHR